MTAEAGCTGTAASVMSIAAGSAMKASSSTAGRSRSPAQSVCSTVSNM
ncbi:hypothetical protein WBG99_24855 [Streptomyces sp. TG1A-60]